MNSTIKRLDSIHSRFLPIIAGLDTDLLIKRPAESEWSIGEVIHHLFLVEQRVVEELNKNLAKPPARASLLKSLIPMRIVSWRFRRVDAPAAVVPEGFKDTQGSLQQWEECRTTLKELCLANGPRLKQTVLKHPVFGDISGTAAVSMVAFHEQRHLKQIKQILRRIKPN